MNKICSEMNKLWPLLKFLRYYDDDDYDNDTDTDADDTLVTTITWLFFEQPSWKSDLVQIRTHPIMKLIL